MIGCYALDRQGMKWHRIMIKCHVALLRMLGVLKFRLDFRKPFIDETLECCLTRLILNKQSISLSNRIKYNPK